MGRDWTTLERVENLYFWIDLGGRGIRGDTLHLGTLGVHTVAPKSIKA